MTYYVWANESCDNSTASLTEAIQWAYEFRQDGADYVHIVDENGTIIRE